MYPNVGPDGGNTKITMQGTGFQNQNSRYAGTEDGFQCEFFVETPAPESAKTLLGTTIVTISNFSNTLLTCKTPSLVLAGKVNFKVRLKLGKYAATPATRGGHPGCPNDCEETGKFNFFAYPANMTTTRVNTFQGPATGGQKVTFELSYTVPWINGPTGIYREAKLAYARVRFYKEDANGVVPVLVGGKIQCTSQQGKASEVQPRLSFDGQNYLATSVSFLATCPGERPFLDIHKGDCNKIDCCSVCPNPKGQKGLVNCDGSPYFKLLKDTYRDTNPKKASKDGWYTHQCQPKRCQAGSSTVETTVKVSGIQNGYNLTLLEEQAIAAMNLAVKSGVTNCTTTGSAPGMARLTFVVYSSKTATIQPSVLVPEMKTHLDDKTAGSGFEYHLKKKYDAWVEKQKIEAAIGGRRAQVTLTVTVEKYPKEVHRAYSNCVPGTKGPMCGVCQDNWYSTAGGCKSCDGEGGGWQTSTIVFFIVVLVIIVSIIGCLGYAFYTVNQVETVAEAELRISEMPDGPEKQVEEWDLQDLKVRAAERALEQEKMRQMLVSSNDDDISGAKSFEEQQADANKMVETATTVVGDKLGVDLSGMEMGTVGEDSAKAAADTANIAGESITVFGEFGSYFAVIGGCFAEVVPKVKIALSYFQIVSFFNVSFDVNWPESYNTWIDTVKLVNFNWVTMFSVACHGSTWNFLSEFYCTMFLPLMFVGVWLGIMVYKVNGLKNNPTLYRCENISKAFSWSKKRA
jgi:hypothetical protein